VLFWLKKFLTFWLMPLPFSLSLLVTGWLLCRTVRRGRVGRALIVAGIVLLILFSNKVVSTWLVRPLETRFPPIPELHAGDALPMGLGDCRYVVVLGGGHGDVPGLAASNKLSSSALSRLVEGIRLLRLMPAATLIVSGPAAGGNPSHAVVLAEAAAALGVLPGRIRQITTARDTEDEAAAVKAIAGEAPVALVTSAWHMPRAVGLFRHARVAIVPCPADYSARPNADFRWEDLTWDVESLERSTQAVHERLGYLWESLRGRTH